MYRRKVENIQNLHTIRSMTIENTEKLVKSKKRSGRQLKNGKIDKNCWKLAVNATGWHCRCSCSSGQITLFACRKCKGDGESTRQAMKEQNAKERSYLNQASHFSEADEMLFYLNFIIFILLFYGRAYFTHISSHRNVIAIFCPPISHTSVACFLRRA